MNISIPGLKRSGNDSKYFSTTKKGEIHELKEELHNPKVDKKKDAVKKVIAAMTVGKDVSSLFPDVLNCMQTGLIDLKKLVYLYLINYAKSSPDMAILAVNTFRKDANDPNPLIRALAIRTMGCIRVDKITEYLCDPLRRACKDDDPYVRKTAAICVAKLFDINPSLAEEQGFLELLKELIVDSNPSVVANAVASMLEVSNSFDDPSSVFSVDSQMLSQLLAALGECAEWGQIDILDALCLYNPKNCREAENVIERVSPRLQHSNASVVMSSVKVIVKFLEFVDDPDVIKSLSKKMSPPLVTLLSAEPEIQYITLRNINLIVQKRPTILTSEIRVFFCRYNDPIYVKMEKLEIMIKLCSDKNAEQVLQELKEYASEVDVDFVRRAVRSIGRCAIKLERSAERCINVLLDLIKTKVNYVVQESIIVIKDIFRKYPNRYESIIATLCDNLDILDEPEAKASMIWIVGEYAERIDNADELLETFLDSFQDEMAEVQLQLLSATVKLFLKRPDGSKELMENVLSMATEQSDNPDLRDRGYIYWRLLSTDPEAALRVVLADKAIIIDDTDCIEPTLLNMLVDNISSLASIYHKPPDTFVKKIRIPLGEADDDESDMSDESSDSDNDETPSKEPSSSGTTMDLLDFGSVSPKKSNGRGSSSNTLPVLIQDASGLRLDGALVRRNGSIFLDMDFWNISSSTSFSKFAIQFNKNTFALAPASVNVELHSAISTGEGPSRASIAVIINPKMAKTGSPPSLVIDIALKNVALSSVEYFKLEVPFQVLFKEDGEIEKKSFVESWKSIQEEKVSTIRGIFSIDTDEVENELSHHNIFAIATRKRGEGETVAYYSLLTTTGSSVLLELMFKEGFDACKLTLKSDKPQVIGFVQKALHDLLI